MFSRIPEKMFEAAGIVAGFAVCASIAFQVWTELTTKASGAVSPFYLLGFFLMFAFWALYGVRFRRLAMWLVNSVAAALQGILLLIAMIK